MEEASMTTASEVMQTADATRAYRERSGVDIARADSTASDGTLASFTRDNTLVVSTTTFYPVHASRDIVYVRMLEEQVRVQFLPR
jgi:hypothetical protein